MLLTVFAGLRTIVVDEVHAFAGDDRGWHLLAVLERLARLVGPAHPAHRSSATVGTGGPVATRMFEETVAR